MIWRDGSLTINSFLYNKRNEHFIKFFECVIYNKIQTLIVFILLTSDTSILLFYINIFNICRRKNNNLET